MNVLQQIDQIVHAERIKQEDDLKNLAKMVELIKDLDQKFEERLGEIVALINTNL